jgi:hypothetical protein
MPEQVRHDEEGKVMRASPPSVIPAKAGTQGYYTQRLWLWVLTFVRMTHDCGMTHDRQDDARSSGAP